MFERFFKNDKEKTTEIISVEKKFAEDIEDFFKIKAKITASPKSDDSPYKRNFVFEISDGKGRLPKELSRLSKEEIEFFLFQKYGAVTIDYPVKIENQAKYKKEKRILTGKTISINENIIKQIDKSNKITKEDEIKAVFKIFERSEFAELVASMLFKERTIEYKLNENIEFAKTSEIFQKELLAVLKKNGISEDLYVSSIATFAKESKLKEQTLPELYKIEDILETYTEAGKEIPAMFRGKPVILGSKFTPKNDQEPFKKLLECDELRVFLVKNLMNLYPLAKELDRRESFKRPQITTSLKRNPDEETYDEKDENYRKKSFKRPESIKLKYKGVFPSADSDFKKVGRNPETGRDSYEPKGGWRIKDAKPIVKATPSKRHLIEGIEDKVVDKVEEEKPFDWEAARIASRVRVENSEVISGDKPKLIKREAFKNSVEAPEELGLKPVKVCSLDIKSTKPALQRRDRIPRGNPCLDFPVANASSEEGRYESNEIGGSDGKVLHIEKTLKVRPRTAHPNSTIPRPIAADKTDRFASKENKGAILPSTIIEKKEDSKRQKNKSFD